jgi:nucleotide-binding universal stress UspA family protein
MSIRVVADGADGYRLLSANNELAGWVRGRAIGVAGFADDGALGTEQCVRRSLVAGADYTLGIGGLVTSLHFATPSSQLSPPVADTLFPRVLLAIDFGSASLGAARWATTHIASGGEAVLMHVVPSDVEPSTSGTHRDAEGESLRGLTPAITGGLGGFAATLDVAGARSVVRLGRPSSSLAAVTNDAEASVLVLGRRAAANRIRVGEPNVIERVTRRTNASVLVVPEGTTRAPDRVVAAVDDSRFAPLVLRIANRLARLHEVPLTVLHVLSPVVGAYERVIRTAKQLLVSPEHRKAKETPRPVRLSPSTPRWLVYLARAHTVIGRDSIEVAMGDPACEITRVVTERKASLLVIGRRGADEAPAGSIGSVARELLMRAPVPVLAVNGI